MELNRIDINIDAYPEELHSFLEGAKIYNSSCSPEAVVLFIDKDYGYFLKSAKIGSLSHEAKMTQYFYKKNLSAQVLLYKSYEKDWLLTTKIDGEDCASPMYLNDPHRLCDTLSQALLMLHSIDFADCPILDCNKLYLDRAEQELKGKGIDCQFIQNHWHMLQRDTLIHGDYCLPNIILKDWHFSGFIDFDMGGVGDRHLDLFWGAWTLQYNLKTDKYRQRFFDGYGRDRIDDDTIRIVEMSSNYL